MDDMSSKFKKVYVKKELLVKKSNDANEKVSQMPSGSPIQVNDVMPFVRQASGNWTNYIGPVSDIINLVPSAAPGLSPYQSTLDNAGTLPNHYVNLGAAYAANKPYTFTIANITEGASITMSATDQIYLQVGQNFSWNLGANQIIASSANDFSLVLSDGSATFQYAMTGTNIPFDSFDVNSTIMLNGNGGIFQNTSLVANSFIYSDGALVASNIKKFLLPNASAGGFKTNTYHSLSNIVFIGGGNNCDKAIIANGGNISNIILSGNNWASGAFLFDTTTKTTTYTNIFVDINIPVSLPINGKASKLLTNPANTSGFLTVPLSSNSELENCNVDACVLVSGTTNCKLIGGNCGSISLANDNSTEVYCNGVTFTDNVQVYGKFTAVGCTFLGGIQLMNGAVFVSISNSKSSTPLVDSGAVYLIRSANDENVGNDPIAKLIRDIDHTNSPFTAQINDLIVGDTTGGDITILLPGASGSRLGKDIYVSLIGSGTITITPNGTDTILGLTSKTLTGNGSAYALAARLADWRIF